MSREFTPKMVQVSYPLGITTIQYVVPRRIVGRSLDLIFIGLRDVYFVHVITRKLLGDMTRKLSVTESRNRAQFLGTLSRRNPSVASANWLKVA